MIRFGLAAIVIPIIIYLLAGTLLYWQGWLYWAVIVLPMLVAVHYFLKHEPEMLERRMNLQEREKEQIVIVNAISLIIIARICSHCH